MGAATLMNAAINSAAETRGTGERTTDPSMEEILASIRRIIADEQAAAPTTASVQPIRPEKIAAPAPEPVRTDGEFESWLAQTASRNALAAQKSAPAPEPVAVPAPVIPEPQYMRETIVHAPAAANEGYAEHPPVQEAPDVYEAAPAVEPPQTYHQAYQHEPAAAPAHYYAAPAVAHHPEPAFQAPRLSVVPPAPVEEEPAHQHHDDLETPLRPSLQPEDLLSNVAGSSVQASFQALAQTMFMQNTGLVEDAVREMLRPMLKQWLDDNLPIMVERLVRAEIERVARGGR